MKHKDIKKNIIDEIKSGQIQPTSRWRFMAHDYFFWALAGSSLVFGTLAFSSVLHQLTIQQIRPMRDSFGPESVPVFLETLPYLWILILALFITAAWFNFKKTSGSYRKHNVVVVVAVLGMSLLFGGCLYATGIGKQVDERTRKHIPMFKQDFQRRENIRNKFMEKRIENRPASQTNSREK